MVRNVITEVFTQRGFHDLHVFDEYFIEVPSLFVCGCGIVECRSKFLFLQGLTDSWELLFKVTTDYYLRLSVLFQDVCSYLRYSCCSFLHSFIISRLNEAVEDIYKGASYYCFCPNTSSVALYRRLGTTTTQLTPLSDSLFLSGLDSKRFPWLKSID